MGMNRTARRRRALLLLVLVLLAVVGIIWAVTALGGHTERDHEDDEQATSSNQDAADHTETHAAESSAEPTPANPTPSPEPTPEPTPERASDPHTDPDSIHVLVNRQNPLEPGDYAPEDLVTAPVPHYGPTDAMTLREEPAEALAKLFAEAAQEGLELGLVSAYRSYAYQVQIYGNRHAEVGTAETDLYMARPGYSEHQTGLAADVTAINNAECGYLGSCFGETPEGQWVAENAHHFGFVVRYLEGMEDITGYPYEPWHLRYVGEDTAAEVFDQGLTLEQYWGEPPAADYDRDEPSPEQLGR